MTAEITKLNLVKFGKFKNFEIDAEEGLNVFYGRNEAGKSTINLFIKSMLYGMSARKKAGETVKERERAIPWDEKNAEGVLSVKVGNRTIEIRRVFGKTSKGDKLYVYDASTGDSIDDFCESSVGQWLFGISQAVFEKTLWVSQKGIYMGGCEEELLRKIINLSDGGDENASAGEAVKKLTELRKEIKAKNKSNNPGKLDILEQRLESCKKEKYDLLSRLTQEEATGVRKKEAEEELLNIERKMADLEKTYNESLEYEKSLAEIEVYKRICDCDAKILDINNNEEYKKGKGLTQEITESASSAKKRICDLENELSHTNWELERLRIWKNGRDISVVPIVLGVVLGVLGIVGIVLFLSIFPQRTLALLSFVICIVSVLIVVFGVMRIKKNVKIMLENGEKEKQAVIKINSIESEITALSRDLKSILDDYGVENADSLNSLYLTAQGFEERLNSIKDMKEELCKKYDVERLKVTANKFVDMEIESTDSIDKKLREARQKHLELIAEIKGIESKMAYQAVEHRIPADIDTEINSIKEEIKVYNHKLSVIDTAIKYIEAAAEEWRTMVTPKLNNSVNEIMSYLTEGRYNEVRVSDSFSMRVVADRNLCDAEFLSTGTYEQLYLALRIALSNYENRKNPMFLDDILTVYDDVRAEAALKYLIKVNKGSVFLFTCHRFIREKAEALGANIINL